MNNSTTFIKLTAAVCLWGGSFIATKLALREISPLTLIWLRFGMGVVVLGFVAFLRRQMALPSLKDLPNLLLLGLIGITFHQWLQSTGLVTSQASTTAWIVASIPIFTALIGWLILKEKLILVQGGGILLAALGVLIVVSGGDISRIIQSGFGRAGDLLILISAPNWSVFSVLSRRILLARPAAWAMFFVMLFGWFFTGFLLVAGPGWSEIGSLTAGGWIAVFFLGILCSGIAYVFYYDALEALPASQVGVFVYFEPLIAVIVAALILDEKTSLAALVGGLLILSGVWLVQRFAMSHRH